MNALTRTQLWPHQREALERFSAKNGFALFFEMGTGKTLTAIAGYLEKCRQAHRPISLLIVCPTAMVRTWARALEAEISRELYAEVRTLEGSGYQRIESLKRPGARIFITNIEAASMKDFWTAVEEYPFEFLILDESQRCKSHNGVRTKNIIRVADSCAYRLILSGTPILNTMMDVWAQFRILGGDLVGKNFYEWRARHFYDRNAGKRWLSYSDWQLKPGAEVRIATLMAEHSMRVLKSETLNLPPLLRQTVYVDLTPKLARHYKEMERDFLTEIDEDRVCEAEIILTKLLRLQQITCGLLPTADGKVLRETCPKLGALIELLDDLPATTKVIVWANFIGALDDIEGVCQFVKRKYVSIRGGQTPDERQAAQDAFNQDPRVTVCVANQAAGGVGIGLQAASVMIYYSKAFHLEHDLQSESRNHRGGSEIHESITRIDIVTNNTVEEQITDALAGKKALGDLLFSIKRERAA